MPRSMWLPLAARSVCRADCAVQHSVRFAHFDRANFQYWLCTPTLVHQKNTPRCTIHSQDLGALVAGATKVGMPAVQTRVCFFQAHKQEDRREGAESTSKGEGCGVKRTGKQSMGLFISLDMYEYDEDACNGRAGNVFPAYSPRLRT